MADSDSLMDVDDGTTVSYYTAKESRVDTTHQSTLSLGSDETIGPLQQPTVKDDVVTNIISPEDNYYYDALASPSHANQQILSITDQQIPSTDHLTNLLEQIEMYNRTSRTLLPTVDEEKSTLSFEEEESSNQFDRVISVVDDLHQYHQIEPMNAMDNLIFVYDDPEREPQTSSIDHLVEIVHTIHQAPVVVNNLLFIYDELPTPSDDDSKPVKHDSDEWSYDNLVYDQTNTDNLDFVVHEALTTTRYQRRVQYKRVEEIEESTIDTDNLGTLIHDVLSTRSEKRIDEISEFIVNKNSFDEVVQDVSLVKAREHADDTGHDMEVSMPPTTNLDTVVYDVLSTKSKKIPSDIDDPIQESMTDMSNLGEIIHDVLSTKLRKRMNGMDNEVKDSMADTRNLDTIIHDVLSTRLQKPIQDIVYQVSEPTVDTDNLSNIVHDALTVQYQDPINTESIIIEVDQIVPREQSPETINEPTFDISTDEYRHESVSFTDDQTEDTHTFESITYEVEPSNEQSEDTHTFESVTYEIEPSNEPTEDTHTFESITYEIEPSNEQIITVPVSNLSQIVSGTLLTNYQQDKNGFEFQITHKPDYDEEIYEEYGYRRTTTDDSNDIVEKYEELCQQYINSCDSYTTASTKFDDDIDQFERQVREQRQEPLSPTSDTTSEELITTIERIVDMRDSSPTKRNETDAYCSIINVQRQPDYFGKYGFDFEESFDGKLQISRIFNANFCRYLNIGDEIISINNDRSFKTREQCQALLDSLWENYYENISITVIKPGLIPIIQGEYKFKFYFNLFLSETLSKRINVTS